MHTFSFHSVAPLRSLRILVCHRLHQPVCNGHNGWPLGLQAEPATRHAEPARHTPPPRNGPPTPRNRNRHLPRRGTGEPPDVGGTEHHQSCEDGIMAVILEKDLPRGREALHQWYEAAQEAAAAASDLAQRLAVSPKLPRPVWAMAVRYSLFLLERRAPGPGVEVRVAPWGAVKILDGPESDPHNLTPPDVIELDPDVWLRLACGITAWAEEKEAGRISAVGERDDLSGLLPLVSPAR